MRIICCCKTHYHVHSKRLLVCFWFCFCLTDGRTEPNLDDVALAFNDLNINVADLEEYITNVDPVPCIINVPKFPISKESNLNFLKPGSKEVVTRPVHIHEHLPPIQPHEGKVFFPFLGNQMKCQVVIFFSFSFLLLFSFLIFRNTTS